MKERSLSNATILDANFARKEDMDEHIPSVHEEKKPFKCNVCGDASFVKKRCSNKHKASVHEGRSLSNINDRGL